MSQKKKILLIDDDPMVIVTTRVALETEGFIVSSASDGAKGLEKAKKIRPDLIVVDVMMPQENGLLFLSNIREDGELRNIPVIVSTNLEKTMPLIQGIENVEFILKSKMSTMEIVNKIKDILKVA